jgi:hypothetical protein
MERSADNDQQSTIGRTSTTEDTEITKTVFQKCRHGCRNIAFVSFVSFVVNGCSGRPSEPQPIVAVTRPVGSWQGRGTATVGDVPSETGRFRIMWQTSNESPAGAGTFKLTLRSAISGRTLGIVADHKGVGAGTAEYDEGPRTYDFLVESTNVDWSFKVEETSGAYANGSPSSVPGKR